MSRIFLRGMANGGCWIVLLLPICLTGAGLHGVHGEVGGPSVAIHAPTLRPLWPHQFFENQMAPISHSVFGGRDNMQVRKSPKKSVEGDGSVLLLREMFDISDEEDVEPHGDHVQLQLPQEKPFQQFLPGSPGSLRTPDMAGKESLDSWNCLMGQTKGNGYPGLESAWSCLPHPVKAYRGGEDVHMVVNVGDVSLIGVFDGVGGWADLGIDSAMYAREIARIIEQEFRKMPDICYHDDKPLLTLLDTAYQELKKQQLPGSCTVCLVMYTTDRGLHVLNLGDSGIHVVRDGKSVFATYEQQHYFNCPFQIGMGSDDTPYDADYVVLDDVAPGDLIVAATDGVWDNVYEEEMLRIIQEKKMKPRSIAQALGALSQKHGQDKEYSSPFAASALTQGLSYYGGKLDDVTVVVSKIVAE